MRTAAILPVKRFAKAKQRLGVSVPDPLRARLAQAMVGDVLVALSHSTLIERTIVVTNEHQVARAASYLGATVLPDSTEQGQSAAVKLGLSHAIGEEFQRALCIPGDCPALDPQELDDLLSAHLHEQERSVVIVPDRHGTGTNGLLLSPPDAIQPSFGENSCERHLELAQSGQVRCEIDRRASLMLDIDTADDLTALRERLSNEHIRAPRTRKVLGLKDSSWPASRPAA